MVFRLLLVLQLLCFPRTIESFATPKPLLSLSLHWQSKTILLEKRKPLDVVNDDKNGNPFSFLLNPYNSKIPEEIRKEIYEAEANTEAAKERNKRIGWYIFTALVGIGMAFFNNFLSQLRTSETPEGLTPFDIHQSPFAWVEGNFLTQFLFINKIGGLLCLLLGGAAGLLVEAEFDTRRIQAEKIYQELVLRQTQKQQQQRGTTEKNLDTPRKKKRAGKREYKRMGALAEVLDDSTTNVRFTEKNDPQTNQSPPPPPPQQSSPLSSTTTTTTTANQEGILSSWKQFYEKADTLAASQALLLNKKLEDAGVLEKITDETGLRVIGQAATAAKPENKMLDIKNNKNDQSNPQT